jgi:hypothetical protein
MLYLTLESFGTSQSFSLGLYQVVHQNRRAEAVFLLVIADIFSCKPK